PQPVPAQPQPAPAQPQPAPAQPQQAERPAVRGTVPLAPQEQQPRRQQDLPTVVEPDLGAGSSDLDVPDFLK
ncbi:cell division protein FtsZ, partial [Micrococcus luteus]|nr:cell division protein FtsZ [Micrococcus luteus]